MTTEQNEASKASHDPAKNADGALAAPGASQKTQSDVEAERARGNDGDTARVMNPNAPEEVAKQHEAEDQFRDKRSSENEEGHAKNMEKIETAAAEAHARTQHADDHRANHVPTGKEHDRNTPRILKDGTKVWDQ